MGTKTENAFAGAARGSKATSSSKCPCVHMGVTSRPASAGAADAAQATTSGHAQEVAHGLQAQQQQQQPPHQPPPHQADSPAVAGVPAGHTQQLVEGHQAQTLGPPGFGGREAAAAAGRGGVKSPPAQQGKCMSCCMGAAVCWWSEILVGLAAASRPCLHTAVSLQLPAHGPRSAAGTLLRAGQSNCQSHALKRKGCFCYAVGGCC